MNRFFILINLNSKIGNSFGYFLHNNSSGNIFVSYHDNFILQGSHSISHMFKIQ